MTQISEPRRWRDCSSRSRCGSAPRPTCCAAWGSGTGRARGVRRARARRWPGLAHRAPVTKGDAVRLLRAARLARDHERTGKVLAAGDVSSAHVQVLARAVRHHEDQYPDHEDILVDAATEHTPELFQGLARRWRALADDVARWPTPRRCSCPAVSTARRPSAALSLVTSSSTPKAAPPCSRPSRRATQRRCVAIKVPALRRRPRRDHGRVTRRPRTRVGVCRAPSTSLSTSTRSSARRCRTWRRRA